MCLEKEQQLKLRLQMAAAEYRKLYTEKQKVEKRLAKLYHRLNEKKTKSSSSSEQSEACSSVVNGQPTTGELICLLAQPAVSGSRNDTYVINKNLYRITYHRYKGKGTGKAVLQYTMKTNREGGIELHLFLNLALAGDGWYLSALSTLALGTRASLDAVEKRKISCPCRELELLILRYQSCILAPGPIGLSWLGLDN